MNSPLEDALFAELLDVDTATQARLHTRLAAEAEIAGVLDIAYRTVDSPLGMLLLAATDRGLVRVAYAIEDHERVLEDLATRVSARVLQAPARLDPAAREIDEYLAGDAPRSICRWTSDCPAASGGSYSTICPTSLTAQQQATRQWPRPRAIPRRCEPSGRRAPGTRCPSSCPVIGWSAVTARSDSTPEAARPSARCCPWREPDDGAADRLRLHVDRRGRAAVPQFPSGDDRRSPARAAVRAARLPGRSPGTGSGWLRSRPGLLRRPGHGPDGGIPAVRGLPASAVRGLEAALDVRCG